ncbi:hypothetical protein HELRODRAFT_170346 [Helobdella robusta]|uniref:Uncharacterized protein n=1 Tax=Helobdella robusta TaxID=6412 RepID=T1F2Y4_HELRO|nr:hypothetical protein HELRODRAFT_170346 [Helobdella robusta]ESO07793.1 hypothetical protein HELRODRAFT_170346 [Helobdella robusta]
MSDGRTSFERIHYDAFITNSSLYGVNPECTSLVLKENENLTGKKLDSDIALTRMLIRRLVEKNGLEMKKKIYIDRKMKKEKIEKKRREEIVDGGQSVKERSLNKA